MNLQIDTRAANGYHSHSQIGRVISERWVQNQLYCPFCGEDKLEPYENNRPVADFHCTRCNEQFELKSKNGKETLRIVDGAYATMIQRITSDENPNFLLMFYSGAPLQVQQLILVPKYFLSTDMVQKRKPLPENARRAGWVGCNLHLDRVPDDGMIRIVENGRETERREVLTIAKRTRFLSSFAQDRRGWLLDTIQCIQRIAKPVFTLEEVYAFTEELSLKYPLNHHIRDKLRQQLQLLRDHGYVEFLGNGLYRITTMTK